MPYAILRMKKQHGGSATALEKHHEREKEAYASNPDIDVNRSCQNYHIKEPEGKYYAEIQKRIEAAQCRVRKDSVKIVDTMISGTPEFLHTMPEEEQKVFFRRAYDFMAKKIGEDNIVSAVVHMDEATPHMHLCFVPLTRDRRLSAKELLGNRSALRRWQDDYHAYMSERFPMLERGEPAAETGRQHKTTAEYKSDMARPMELMKALQRVRQLERHWQKVPYPIMKKIHEQEQARAQHKNNRNYER